MSLTFALSSAILHVSNLTWDIFTPIFQQSAFHCNEYCFLDHILDLIEAMLVVVLIMFSRFPCCVLSYFILAFVMEHKSDKTDKSHKSQLSRSINLIMLHRRVMSSQSRPQHCSCDIYRSPSYKSDLHQYP